MKKYFRIIGLLALILFASVFILKLIAFIISFDLLDSLERALTIFEIVIYGFLGPAIGFLFLRVAKHDELLGYLLNRKKSILLDFFEERQSEGKIIINNKYNIEFSKINMYQLINRKITIICDDDYLIITIPDQELRKSFYSLIKAKCPVEDF